LKIAPLKPAPAPLVIGIARAGGRDSDAVAAFIAATKEKN
jgi:hypothetical protein